MNLEISVKKMIESYSDQMPLLDKLREVLQQTALLGLSRQHFLNMQFSTEGLPLEFYMDLIVIVKV
jgi:hypothetical protein